MDLLKGATATVGLAGPGSRLCRAPMLVGTMSWAAGAVSHSGGALAGRAVVGRALHSTSNCGPIIWGQVSQGRLANGAQGDYNSPRG